MRDVSAAAALHAVQPSEPGGEIGPRAVSGPPRAAVRGEGGPDRWRSVLDAAYVPSVQETVHWLSLIFREAYQSEVNMAFDLQLGQLYEGADAETDPPRSRNVTV